MTLRAALAVLRRECPPVWPVRIRRARVKGRYGDCRLVKADDPYFLIRLDPDLKGGFLLHILAHEVAHACSWTSEHPSVADHSPEFGLAYSRVYQALFER